MRRFQKLIKTQAPSDDQLVLERMLTEVMKEWGCYQFNFKFEGRYYVVTCSRHYIPELHIVRQSLTGGTCQQIGERKLTLLRWLTSDIPE